MVVTEWVMPIDGYCLMILITNYHHFDILAMHEESSSRLKVDDDVHEELFLLIYWIVKQRYGQMYVVVDVRIVQYKLMCVTCSLWFLSTDS